MIKKIVFALLILLAIASSALCSIDNDNYLQTMYKQVKKWGYSRNYGYFTYDILGGGGDIADIGNEELDIFNLFLKYHKGYESDFETWKTDLVENKIKDMTNIVLQLGNVVENRIIDDFYNKYKKAGVDIEREDVKIYDYLGIFGSAVVARVYYEDESLSGVKNNAQVMLNEVKFLYQTYYPHDVWYQGRIYDLASFTGEYSYYPLVKDVVKINLQQIANAHTRNYTQADWDYFNSLIWDKEHCKIYVNLIGDIEIK